MALPLLCERLRHDRGHQLFLNVHPSQPPVLLLQILHIENHRGVQAAELGAQSVERCGADTQLPAQIGH